MNYDLDGFNWKGGIDKFLSGSSIPREPTQQLNIISLRINDLYKKLTKHQLVPISSELISQIDDNNISHNNIDYNFAVKWNQLTLELIKIPFQIVDIKTISIFQKILDETKWFYECDLGSNDEKWNEFVSLQKVS